MRVVVCDDDPTLRSVVSRLAEAVGLTVIAETDSADDAVELVTRFGSEALVIDLSLPWGSGLDAVLELRERAEPCQIVVFTEPSDLTAAAWQAGVRAVVEKPDFETLESVLAQITKGALPAPEAATRERRRPPRARPAVAPGIVRTPSGIEDPDSFALVLEAFEPGDVVLYVHLAAPDGEARGPWAELVHTDRFLAVARILRSALRVQDRLGVDGDVLVALLLDAERAGIEAAWRRLERGHRLTKVGGVVSGGWALCDPGEPGYATQARARDAAARSVGQPPGDRLWAG